MAQRPFEAADHPRRRGDLEALRAFPKGTARDAQAGTAHACRTERLRLLRGLYEVRREMAEEQGSEGAREGHSPLTTRLPPYSISGLAPSAPCGASELSTTKSDE